VRDDNAASAGTMQQVRDDNVTSVGDGTRCRMIGSIITIIIELTKEK
jgi:hypothetical protein